MKLKTLPLAVVLAALDADSGASAAQTDTADALNNLGFLFKKTGNYASKLDQAMGEYGKAEPLLREALRIQRESRARRSQHGA